MFFLLLHYSFLIKFFEGSKTAKFILRDFVELNEARPSAVDSVFQELHWFGNSLAGLIPIKKKTLEGHTLNLVVKFFRKVRYVVLATGVRV